MRNIRNFLWKICGAENEINALQQRIVTLEEEKHELGGRLEKEKLKFNRKLEESWRDLLGLRSNIGDLLDENRGLEEWNKKLVKRIEEAEVDGEFTIRDVGHIDDMSEDAAWFADHLRTWREAKTHTATEAAKNTLMEKRLSTEEAKDFLSDVMLEAIDIQIRTYTALKRSGLNTLGDVVSCRMSELLERWQFGKWCANDLALVLMRDFGLKVADEDDPETQKKIDKILLSSRLKCTSIDNMGFSFGTINAIKKVGRIEDAEELYECECREKDWFKEKLTAEQHDEVRKKLVELGCFV